MALVDGADDRDADALACGLPTNVFVRPAGSREPADVVDEVLDALRREVYREVTVQVGPDEKYPWASVRAAGGDLASAVRERDEEEHLLLSIRARIAAGSDFLESHSVHKNRAQRSCCRPSPLALRTSPR